MSIINRLINRPQSFSIEMLQRGVQNGTIPAYIGIPMIQEKLRDQKEMQGAQAAQAMGQKPPTPVAEQVMAEAAQATAPQPQVPQAPQPQAQQPLQQLAQMQRPRGVEQLRSNLPAQFAHGGIVAFEDGGEVERYADEGLIKRKYAGKFEDLPTYNRPAASSLSDLVGNVFSKSGQRIDPETGEPISLGDFLRKQEAERGREAAFVSGYPTESAMGAGIKTLPPSLAAAPAASTTAAPATPAFVAPTYAVPTIAPTKFSTKEAPPVSDYKAEVKKTSEGAEKAYEKALSAEEERLKALTDPLYKGQKERLEKREEAQKKGSEIERYLDIMSLGFGIAGSKERSLAGALGNEGRQGIKSLVTNEAARRAAADKLQDYRDNLERAEAAEKKGDYRAARTAAREARADKMQAGQLELAALQGKEQAERQNWYQGQQLDLARRGLEQAREIAGAQLGLQTSNLNLESLKLAQSVISQEKQLALKEKQLLATNTANAIRLKQAYLAAGGKWDANFGMVLDQQLQNTHGKNWKTGKDAKSIEAQLIYRQQRASALIDSLSEFELKYGGSGVQDATALLQGNQ